MARTLWYSYANYPPGLDGPEPLSAPLTNTWHFGRYLRAQAQAHGWRFEFRALDDCTPVQFGSDDIAIGHTWIVSGGFMHQALDAPIAGKFVLQPYTHLMTHASDVHHLICTDEDMPQDPLFEKADHLFLICGPYWWDTTPGTQYERIMHKATRVDGAVNAATHAYHKWRWGKVGQRKVLTIGANVPFKDLPAIAAFARTGGFHLGFAGDAHPDIFRHVPRLTYHGFLSWTPETVQALCDEYDFFIAMGRADANPTTLIETACWGLIGACTKETGYWPDQPFWELRHEDMAFNLRQMERWQHMPESELRARSVAMRRLVETDYCWDRWFRTCWDKMMAMLGEESGDDYQS